MTRSVYLGISQHPDTRLSRGTLWRIGRACLPFAFGLAVLALGVSVHAQEPDSVDKDYSGELPRIAPVEPQDALATFKLAPGWRIEQVAAEPLVTDPIAMDWDGNGRAFVIEMRDYSEHPNDSLGRVRRLVDRDGDGRFDESTVFAEGLSWPTAILCIEGGILVGAPPDLIRFWDDDDDGVADRREVLLTGFGRDNVQGMMNSLRWGLDGRVHGAVSSSGAVLRSSRVPDGDGWTLRGRDFAFDLRTGLVDATSGGGQHGMDFDSFGERFVCSNSDHLRHVRYEDRYLARNPAYAAPGPTISIASDGPQADVYRASPVEPWRIVRTRLRTTGVVPGLVEGGGRAAGYFTGATGITLFEPNGETTDETPWAIVADVGGNLVHRKRLTRTGNTFRGDRMDEQSEFLASTDIWFRPVQFSVGHDGGLYVIDMYREVIEHPASLPPPIKRHLDLDSGRDRGRIYRVVPEGFTQPEMPRLGSASIDELIAVLDHPRVWYRRTATRRLIELGDSAAIPPVIALQQDAQTGPLGRLHALSVLNGLGALDEAMLLAGLSDSHREVRRWALRFSERAKLDSPALVRAIAALADDDDLLVRTQAAFTLGSFEGVAVESALARIAVRDFEDEVARVAVTTSLGQRGSLVVASLLRDPSVQASEAGKSWTNELLRQLLARQNDEERVELIGWLERWPSESGEAAAALQARLEVPGDHPWRDAIEAAQGPEGAARRERILAEAMEKAGDREGDLSERVAALRELRRADEAIALPVLESALSPLEPNEVQQAALESLLSRGGSIAVAERLLGRWQELSPALRRAALDRLLERPQWTRALLSAIEAGVLPANDLDGEQLRRLTLHGDQEIRELASRVVTAPRPRDETILAYRPSLEDAGDFERGRGVFQRVCANCHRVGEVGHEVGPSLLSFRNRGAEALLVNVIDPNREINPQFLAYAIETIDGRQVVGMIDSETASSVTLRMAEGKLETIRRSEIEAMRSTGVSLMPEGIERDVDVQGMADLLEFLLRVE